MSTTHDAAGHFVKGTHWREPQVFRDADWLRAEYAVKERSASDIGRQFGVTEGAILFWLRRHAIPRRDVSQARRVKHWGAVGADNPMYGRRGQANGNWRHGLTPERQGFYASAEWSAAVRRVWARDAATCQRCTSRPGRRSTFHVHHVVTFGVRELRTEPSNLVLLCGPCHRWVHSRANQTRLFLGQKGGEL